MRKYYLESIYKKFCRESDWLLAEFVSAITFIGLDSQQRVSRLNAEMAVVRLHDCWARYSRELVVLSAGAKPITANGKVVELAVGVHRIPDVIPALMATYKKNTKEPKWAIPSQAIDAAQRLKIKNLTTVVAALGAMDSPAEEIRPIRNFLVHRSREGALDLRIHSGANFRARLTIEALAGSYVDSGVRQFEKWVIDLKNVALTAIQ